MLLAPLYLIMRASEGGAAGFAALATNRTLDALVRTVLLTVSVTVASALIAIPAAWLTARTDLFGRRLWTVALALPLAVPTFVGGFVMVSTLPAIHGFLGSWLALTFLSYPYIYLPVRAALRRIDPALEEASRSLGKSAGETFRLVTLPQLRPAIAAGAILLALYVVSEFGAVSMLRYDTLTPLVYAEYRSSFDRTSAAVLALPLLVLAGLIVAIEGMTRGAAVYHGNAPSRTQRTRALGRWQLPALLFCAVPTGLGIGLQLVVVTYWLIRGIGEGEATSIVLEAIFNSAQVSSAAALVTVAAAMPIAILAVRHRGPLSDVLEKAAYLGQSIPAITIALSAVFFTANYLTPIYQTLVVLVIAYAVRFLPEALGACRSALVQVNPHTEEAARSLGAGPFRTFLRVTAPQMLPGLSAGGLLVFLTVMKELPITLLLSPIGFITLSTEIWSATTSAFFTRAALPSLVLITLSAGAVLLLVRRERLAI